MLISLNINTILSQEIMNLSWTTKQTIESDTVSQLHNKHNGFKLYNIHSVYQLYYNQSIF